MAFSSSLHCLAPSRTLPVVAFLLGLILPAAAALGQDLSVGWISRSPQIPYVWGSTNPAVEGWPGIGQEVTWTAHVRNLTGATRSGVGYRWTLDGRVVDAGEADLPPGESTFDYPWKWTFERHELEFEIDTGNVVGEIEERNNELLIHTNALAVGFYVEQTFWSSMRAIITNANIGATTFDDWMQKRIRQFNSMASLARYPETPDGVLDRWRIDQIHVVPDGALPLVPLGPEVRDWGADESGYGTLYPDSSNLTVDMEWGFPTSTLEYYAARDSWTLLYDSLVHELGHARYLIDVYAWHLESSHDRFGPVPPPSTPTWLFTSPEAGMMSTSWGFIDRYSAIAMNLIAGHRATMGHYNEPTNIGSFLNDLPARNRVVLRTTDGRRFPGRTVRLYRASGLVDPDWTQHAYRHDIDAIPDAQFVTDAEGGFEIGSNPFSEGPLVIYVDQINVLAILEIDDGGTMRYGYLESRPFNLAYWRGETEFAEHEVIVDAPLCTVGLGPNRIEPGHESLAAGPHVQFSWPGSAKHTYELWVSVDGAPAERVHRVTAARDLLVKRTQYLVGRRVAWWITDETPGTGCPPKRSSIYYFDLDGEKGDRRRPVRR